MPGKRTMPASSASNPAYFSFGITPRQPDRPKIFQQERYSVGDILNLRHSRDYKFKKDEIFRRMKVTTFVQLLVQVGRFNSVQEYVNSGTNGAGDRPDTADREVARIQSSDCRTPVDTQRTAATDSAQESSRSRLEQVIKGVGEVDMNAPPKVPSLMETCPYLLLDIRDKDDYAQCHITSAKSYPIAMLSRSVNYETKDLLACKNASGKIIVIYDEDEKLAPKAATTFVQRGYDNIFMLSGGMRVAYRNFPEGLLTGIPPVSVSERLPKPGETPQPAAKTEFSVDDLDRLEMYLDSALQDRSVGTHRSKSVKRKDEKRSSSNVALSSRAATERGSATKCSGRGHPKVDMGRLSKAGQSRQSNRSTITSRTTTSNVSTTSKPAFKP